MGFKGKLTVVLGAVIITSLLIFTLPLVSQKHKNLLSVDAEGCEYKGKNAINVCNI
jgi:hypothetical protein